MPKLDESLLAPLPPFAGLDRKQLREILDHATPRRFDEGQHVFEEGNDAERFYLLLDGTIRVVRTTDAGEHVIMLHIPAGQLFGIAKALDRTQYPATSVAASECVALSWPQRLWPDFAERYPGFAASTTQVIGKRFSEMQGRLMEMATLHVEQRVANALLRLINQTGRKTGDGIEIAFPITRQDLSEMTGTTLHTVSRLLSAWQKQGLVESRRKHITVRQPHQLVELTQAT